jgi:acyl-CoA oxidase
MDYLTHQRRLFPLIATTYALRSAANHTRSALLELQKEWNATGQKELDPARKREIFLLACGLKAVSTWHRSETLQTAR